MPFYLTILTKPKNVEHYIFFSVFQTQSSSGNETDENPCSFKLLSLEDLLEKASPISDPDERFWENFHLKDEAPQIKQKNSE